MTTAAADNSSATPPALTLAQVHKLVRKKGAKVLWPYRGSVEDGNVIYVDGETIALCWLEGYKSRNDDITFDQVLAVYDEAGPAQELSVFRFRGHLTEAGLRWIAENPRPEQGW